MARVYHTGFEWQSVTDGVEARSFFDTPAISTSIVHGGAASLACTGNISAGFYRGLDMNFTALSALYTRFYFYIDSQDNSADVATTFDLFLGGTNALTVQIVRSGSNYTADTIINNFVTSLGTFAVGIDAWHYIDIYYDTTPADGSEKVTVRYDGVDQITRTNLTLSSKTIDTLQCGVYNGSAGTISGTSVYFDDIAVNSTSGSVNNSWCGEGKIVLAKPTGAGDNAATTGIFSYINEVPPSNTATSGSTMVELDSNGVIADYNVTDSSTLGIGSGDSIRAILVLARVREEAAGTSSYQLRIKSASGGTVSATASADAGNTTVRTNPNSTTQFGRFLISETDPTTGSAWTPTGTNSIDNMQIGVTNNDADSTPDLWVLTMGAMIEYVPSSGTTVTKTVTADAIVKVTETKTVSSDGIVFATSTKTVSSDGVVKETLTTTTTADAVIKVTDNKTAIADGIVFATSTKTLTADAIVQETQTKTVTADGVVIELKTSTLSADGIVFATNTSTLSTDGIVKATSTSSVDVDGIVKVTSLQTLTSDGIVKANTTTTATADGIVLANTQKVLTSDGIVKTTENSSLSADGIVLVTTSSTVTSDAIVKTTETKTVTSDAIVKVNSAQTVVTDAIIKALTLVTITADSIVAETKTLSLSADGIVDSAALARVYSEAVYSEDIYSGLASNPIPTYAEGGVSPIIEISASVTSAVVVANPTIAEVHSVNPELGVFQDITIHIVHNSSTILSIT